MLYKKSHRSVQRQFLTFCEENFYFSKSGSQLPASEITVLRFITYKSATCKLDSLRFYLRVPLVLNNLKRFQGGSKRLRTPITALVLLSMKISA